MKATADEGQIQALSYLFDLARNQERPFAIPESAKQMRLNNIPDVTCMWLTLQNGDLLQQFGIGDPVR